MCFHFSFYSECDKILLPAMRLTSEESCWSDCEVGKLAGTYVDLLHHGFKGGTSVCKVEGETQNGNRDLKNWNRIVLLKI